MNSNQAIILRIPCRNKSARRQHRQFLLRKVKTKLSLALDEISIAYNRADSCVEAILRSDYFIDVINALRIPKGKDFGKYGRVPAKILGSKVALLKVFLRGYGDCCGTVDRHVSGEARVVLNLRYEGTRIVEDLIKAFKKCSITIADVNLPPKNRFRALGKKLRSKYQVKVTYGSKTPQVRIWGEIYDKNIGFNNDFIARKLHGI